MLKAGFSRLDVTPPLGSDLSGYFYRRLAKGVHDPLYLNALAIANDLLLGFSIYATLSILTINYSKSILNSMFSLYSLKSSPRLIKQVKVIFFFSKFTQHKAPPKKSFHQGCQVQIQYTNVTNRLFIIYFLILPHDFTIYYCGFDSGINF